MKRSDLDKFVTGSEEKYGAMIFKTGAPLDDRTTVRCKAALISQTALGEVDPDTKQVTNKKGWIFNGLITADSQTGDLYVLYDRDALELLPDDTILALSDAEIDEKVAKAWKKTASASDLSGLSGVFTFKGVAEAVSPDLSYIVVCETAASQEGETENRPVPIGTAVDLEGDLYYGWSAENTNFWTDSTTLKSSTTIYDRSEITIVGVNWNDSTYYPESEAQGVADQGVILVDLKNSKIIVDNLSYNNADPITVYPYDEGGVYSDSDSLGQGEFVKYTAYQFTAKESTYSTPNEYTVITASPDNSGHVYQIGENEYASNGQIWVKLGSPVEDWIIL